MIRYALKCPQGHRFESWFQSAEGFDALRKAGHLDCPDCGSTDVAKAIMAPQVRPARSAAAAPSAPHDPAPEAPSAPVPSIADDRERALADLRKQVEDNSEYVGMNFATEARSMHEGEAPMRSIYGEAKIEDAKALLEDGLAVTPLPFRPRSKSN